MEPVSFAVGIISLAGLFNTCLDILDKFDSWQGFGRDSRNLAAQFKAHKLRLERWGQSVGLKDGGILDVHHKALDDPRILSTVNELLSAVKDVCSLGDDMFAPSEFASDRMVRNQMPSRNHIRTKESRMQKFNWSLRDKAKRITQVGQFASLVDILYKLIPIGSEEEKSSQIGKYRNSGGSSMRSNENVFDQKDLNTQFGDLLSRLQNEMEAEAKRDMHTWLLGGHLPNETYGRSAERRIEGTCEWILSTPWFLHWYSHDFPAGHPKILWVNAPAGFGKSILCARVVDHLISTLNEPVSHFFFSTDVEREDHYVAIRAWLSQMMSHPTVFALIRDVWALQQGVKATRHDVTDLLRDIVLAVPGCTLVLDGLDECSRMADRRADSIAGFLNTIAQAIAGTQTRLLIVSRDEPEIRNSLSAIDYVLLIQHKITPDLVRPDIDIYSRSIVDRKLAKKTEVVRKDISQKLADRCNGQFLWIKLQENDLRSTVNQTALQRIINATPTGLEDAYERNWMRISRLPNEYRQRAFNILRWAAFALRPLTVNEMAGALLVTEEEDEVLVDEIPDEIDEDFIEIEILNDCSSLLEIRSPDTECLTGMRTIHLAHFSVKEYLLLHIPAQNGMLQLEYKLGSSTEPSESILLAKRCLRYLHCRKVWDSTTEQYQLLSCFRQYAAESWQQHSSVNEKRDNELTKLIHDLFDTGNASWKQWKEWFDLNVAAIIDDQDDQITSTPLWYAVFLGLVDVVQKFNVSKNEIDKRANSGFTALGIACYRGHLEIAKIMLQAGADMTIPTVDGSTPIFTAARNGHIEVVQLLINAGADFREPERTYGSTLLHAATDSGNINIVQLLLDYGADASVKNNAGVTALLTASWDGYLDIVSLLVSKQANIDAADRSGFSPLNAALAEGRLEIAKILLDNHANIEIATERGWTPLHFASRNGSLEIVEILIGKGVDKNSVNREGWTPLLRACYLGHVDVASSLISHGANVDIRDRFNRTALDSASTSGHVQVVRLLLQEGVDIEAIDDDGWTALIAASNAGHFQVVQLLLENGANIEAATKYGWTALINATDKGHFEVAQLLLESGADIKATGDYGWTPLIHALLEGHLKVVELLLDNGAEIEAAGNNGLNALCNASFRGHIDLVSFFLSRGANIDATDNDGGTPLINASYEGHTDIIQLLLENGADIKAATSYGWTAIMHASSKCHLRAVELLLDHGADMKGAGKNDWNALCNASLKGFIQLVSMFLDKGADIEGIDNDGRNALMNASNGGHIEVVQLLLDYGAEIEATNDGRTALKHASYQGHLGIVKLLLENGAGTEATDDEGTALYLASYQGHLGIVKLLLENGANFEAANSSGFTPLSTAAYNGHFEVVRLLLANGATFETTDDTGLTALHHASDAGHLAVVKLLAEKSDAAIQVLDKWGRTVLYRAASMGQTDVIGLCLDNNVPVDLADHWGSTCLFAAVRNGHYEAVKQLMPVTSVTVQTRDSLDRTLFWWAKKSGNVEVVEFLLQHAETAGVDIQDEELQMEISSLSCFDFDICVECFGLGARCMDSSHEMALHEPDVLPGNNDKDSVG
ncbi:hypothetical protein N7507_004002 [Penicillium longicatenatum]|nr:hypothetical protein N7507_004002 [Penicillium longicatenatum]